MGFFEGLGDLVLEAGQSAIEAEFEEGSTVRGNPQAAAPQIPPSATIQPNVQANANSQPQAIGVSAANLRLSSWQIAGLSVAGVLAVILVVRLVK